jgi:hypothetical protein
MNRKERRAMKSQRRHAKGSSVVGAMESRIKDAIERADLVVYINPALPGTVIQIERSLMEQYGMDYAGSVMLQAENNRKELSRPGFSPETFAMIEGKCNRWRGCDLPDLHYLWFNGDTYVTNKALFPYDMI